MAVKRIVDVSFWTDGKVDDFSPEDKYFMLYLLTCPFTTQLGIYEISVKQAAFQIGYSVDAVNVLLDRFESKYGVIQYSKETHEVAVKNYLRHSIIKGGAPVRDCLIKELKAVKNRSLIDWVFSNIKGYENLNETVKNIIAEYEAKNGVLYYCNEKQNDNDNDNDNDNEESYHDSLDDSLKQTNQIKRTDYQQIADLYNEICISFPRLKSLSDSRKKAIKARLNTYSVDDFKSLFEKAEASDFLKGKNDRNWSATFDWLIKDSNMAKVLEGQYSNKPKQATGRKEVVPAWMSKPNKFHNYQQRNEDYDSLVDQNDPLMRTAANDEGIRERAEALKRQFAGT